MTERFREEQFEPDDIGSEVDLYLQCNEELTKILIEAKVQQEAPTSSEDATKIRGFIIGKVLTDEDMNGKSYYALYPFDPVIRFQETVSDQDTAEVTIHNPEILYESNLEKGIIPEKWDIVLAEKYTHRRGNKSINLHKRQK
jgi:hypothetical protein